MSPHRVENDDPAVNDIHIDDAAEFTGTVPLPPDLPLERSVMAEDLDVSAAHSVNQITQFPVPDDQPSGTLDDPRTIGVAEADQFVDFDSAVVAEIEVAPVEDFLGGEGGDGENNEGQGQYEEQGTGPH